MLRILTVRRFYKRVADVSGAVFEQGLIHTEAVCFCELRGEGNDGSSVALPERVSLPKRGDKFCKSLSGFMDAEG